MLDTLISIDQSVLLFFNSMHCDALDPIINFLSRNRLIWLPLYLLIIYFMVRNFGWRRGLIYVAGAAIAVGLADYICASVIRPEVQRLRPSNPDNPVSEFVHLYRNYRSSKFTFPSCHGANTFALATFTSLVFRRRSVTIAIFAWAIFMCYTRMYLGVHYPGDLLAGAAIGSLIATGCYYAARTINRLWPGAAVTILILAVLPAEATAQKIDSESPKFEWSIDFRSVFDNRECDARYTDCKTFFLAQLSPEIGVSFSDRRHLVSGGVVYTQPIGCEWDGHRLSPTLYYMYKVPRTRFALGMIPRRHLIRELPNYLMSDSANYFQSNIRGAMVALQRPDGFFQAFIDWRGMQGEKRREAFHIIGQGEWQRPGGMFMAGGVGMLNHLARRKNAPASERVIDNFVVNPYVGLDLTPKVSPIDSLSLRVGPITSITRNRAEGGWIVPIGLWAELDMSWWRLSLQNTLYVGNKPLFPLYSQFGSLLNDGEPYYASKFYNRTSLLGHIFVYKDMVNLDAALDFHVAERNFTFYQRLILRVFI